MFSTDSPITGTKYRTFLAVFLSAVMAGSILAAAPAAALRPALAAKDDNGEKDYSAKKGDPNFEIKKFMRKDNGNLVVKVKGVAGGTVPAKLAPGQLGQVYVYAFFTDNGVWVINAHWECHTWSGCDPSGQHVSEWHAERVVLANVDGYDKVCVTEIADERPATMDGHLGIVHVPEASKIISVQTASFDLKTNPDNPQQPCIAELNTVFDQSSHEEKGDD